MSFKPAHKPCPHGVGVCKRRTSEHYRKMAKAAHDKMVPPLPQRFYCKVKMGTDAECWQWTGYKTRTGSGRFGVGKSVKVASRVAWEIQNGPIPDGLYVLHKCDNPACVNHHHLFLGNQKDNVDDMWSKGRANPVRGENHRDCKLSIIDVGEIRASNLAWSKLAALYGVTKSAIQGIKSGKNWKHI